MTTVHLSCAGCGKLMRKTKTSAPQGEAMCRECRRSRKSVIHGAQYAYRKGCRCEVCREGQRLRIRAYNERVRLRDGVPYTTQRRRKLRGADPLAMPTCSVCGEAMALDRGGPNPVHKSCKPHSDFHIPRKVRLSIYERDEWTCTICNHPVDPDADSLSDWYPTLDHIIPQSAQLIPDHSPGNLRLACRYCNLARGNRGATDEEVAARASERRIALA